MAAADRALAQVAVAGLGKRYGAHRALVGVDLTLRAGAACALLGPNGAGKSTLVGILSTLVRPTAGRVTYTTGAGGAAEGGTLRREIGVLAHDSLLYGELTAIENLRFYGRLYDVDRVDERAEALCEEVGLSAEARGRQARTYSRGMLQRLALARALLHEPSLLLLDEPFTGLDRDGAAALGAALARAKQAGRIVLCVTHDFDAVGGVCDHVAVLRGGRLAVDERAAGGAGFSSAELRARYHGAES